MPHFSFDISSSHDLYLKLKENHNDFLKEKTSVRFALNCAMTAWHIIDWIAIQKGITKSELKKFKEDFKSKCSSLEIMQDLCNGTKHCQINNYTPRVKNTEKHIGDYSNDFNNDFDISRLIVELSDGSKKRFADEIEIVVRFWKDYFKQS